MVVEKPKKELSLEEQKTALLAEVEKKEALLQQLEADIAEQTKKKAEQDAAELAEKIRKAKEEQVFLLEQSKEADDKLKKLMAQSVQENSEAPPAPKKSKYDQVQELVDTARTLIEDENNPVEKSAAEQIQETVKEIKESQMAAGEKFTVNSEKWVLSDVDEPERIGFWGKVKATLRKSLTSLQVIAMLVFLGVSWGGFKYYEWKIDKFNASLSDEQLLTQKINAYNDSNIQRVFFEAGNIGIKVLLALVILFIISPMTVKYIVPFLSGKVNFSEDFINVQPWVRLIVVCVLFFAVLLFLGLMATVNTY